MPVMGPGQASQEYINKIYRSVLDFLKENHNIYVEIDGEINLKSPFPLVEKQRNEVLNRFKDSIGEICQLNIDLSW